MTSMNKRFRELRKQVAECGLQLESMTTSGGTHIRLVVRRTDNRIKTVIVALTPSDRRADLNNRALLRRFAKEAT